MVKNRNDERANQRPKDCADTSGKAGAPGGHCRDRVEFIAFSDAASRRGAVIFIKSGIRFDPTRHRLNLLQIQSLSKRQRDACTLRCDESCADSRKFRLIDNGHRLTKNIRAEFDEGVRT